MKDYIILYYPLELKLYIINKINHSTFSLENHLDKFLFIAHLFYSRDHTRDYYVNGIPINIIKLRNLIAESRAELFLKTLCKWDVINKTKNHSEGRFSGAYELLSPYKSQPYRRNKHYPKDSRHWLCKIIKDRYDNHGDKPATNIEKFQLAVLDRITFSKEFYCDFAIEYPGIDLHNLPESFMWKQEHDGIFRLMFKTDRYSKRRPDEKGRLYTNITNLKKEYRKYILVDGKNLMSLDIKGSQLFLGLFKIESFIKMKAGKSNLGRGYAGRF